MGVDKRSTRRSSKNRAGAMLAGMIGLSGLAGLTAGLAGCTSYTNVPGPDNYTARQDPNARQASAATETGLIWAVRRHPVQGRYAINLPIGTSLETAERIAEALGPNAVIPDSTDIDLPTYHVTRVWIRVSDAKVDVVYPLTTTDGRQITRGVTAWMHAGVRPWIVSRGQYWAPGTIQTPPIWVPLPEAELEAMEDAARGAEAPPRHPDRSDEPQQTQPQDEPQAEPISDPELPQPTPGDQPESEPESDDTGEGA